VRDFIVVIGFCRGIPVYVFPLHILRSHFSIAFVFHNHQQFIPRYLVHCYCEITDLTTPVKTAFLAIDHLPPLLWLITAEDTSSRQICYDIEWPDGWEGLRKKGAQIVFWPSAFAAGKKINTKAWRNQYCVVSSTRKDTTKICDITGEEVAASGHWKRWGVCAPVNLEKAFLHSWPYAHSFPDIVKRYGRKVGCYSLHEEEFSIIESLSPELKVADILREFNLKSYREHLKMAEDEQRMLRA
jgi:hypothetical protein